MTEAKPRSILVFSGLSYIINQFDFCLTETRVLLLNVVQEKRLDTLFKGDKVKALTKMSNCENLILYFSKEVQKIAASAMLFGFQ